MRKIWQIIPIIFFIMSNVSYAQDESPTTEEQYLKTIASFSSNNIYLSLTTISVIKQNIELDDDTTRYSNYSDVVNSVIFTIEDEIKKLGEILEKQALNKDDNKFLKEIIKTLFSMKEDSKLLMTYLRTKADEDFNKFNDYHKTVVESVEKLYSTNK
ncbi:MAG: hypothetical protein EPN82_03800 [Bacteroidetes bacterium]|nr:MAG: hypothetical protein EPN82_03800 [Bacteroidota bacterium]